MLAENSVELALIGVTLAVVGRIVFDWLRGRRNNGPRHRCLDCQDFRTLCEDSRWLREVHDRRDQDGVPLWYFPSTVRHDIGKLLTAQIETNVYLKDIVTTLRARGGG